MNRLLTVIAAAAVASVPTFLGSCSLLKSATSLEVDVERIEIPLASIADRAEVYVSSDESIGPSERGLGMELVVKARTIVEAGGSVGLGELESVVEPLCVLHDAYVAVDGALIELERSTYLRSSAILFRIVDEVRNGGPPGGG